MLPLDEMLGKDVESKDATGVVAKDNRFCGVEELIVKEVSNDAQPVLLDEEDDGCTTELNPKGSVLSVTVTVVVGGFCSDKKSIKLLEFSLVKLVAPTVTLPSTELKLLEDPNL